MAKQRKVPDFDSSDNPKVTLSPEQHLLFRKVSAEIHAVGLLVGMFIFQIIWYVDSDSDTEKALLALASTSTFFLLALASLIRERKNR